jgi:hypothetical protein
MAGKMKTTQASRTDQPVLVVVVNPLAVARGHRQMKRGGVHRTARKPSRAQTKRMLRRDLAGPVNGLVVKRECSTPSSFA